MPLLWSVTLIWLCRSQTLCANKESYCLRGLSVNDFNSGISNRYVYSGTLNGCSYFKSFDGLLFLFRSQAGNWIINTNTESGYTAYCSESQLDDCGASKWNYYDGTIPATYIKSQLQIQSCSYNNTQCSQTYSSNDTFCIAHTDHLSSNSAVAGKYIFKGCYMNQPAFQHIVDQGINFTIFWNDVLSIWPISSAIGSIDRYGYCSKSNIIECTNNWVIGAVFTSITISGFCTSYVNIFLSNLIACYYSNILILYQIRLRSKCDI